MTNQSGIWIQSLFRTCIASLSTDNYTSETSAMRRHGWKTEIIRASWRLVSPFCLLVQYSKNVQCKCPLRWKRENHHAKPT